MPKTNACLCTPSINKTIPGIIIFHNKQNQKQITFLGKELLIMQYIIPLNIIQQQT